MSEIYLHFYFGSLALSDTGINISLKNRHCFLVLHIFEKTYDSSLFWSFKSTELYKLSGVGIVCGHKPLNFLSFVVDNIYFLDTLLLKYILKFISITSVICPDIWKKVIRIYNYISIFITVNEYMHFHFSSYLCTL